MTVEIWESSSRDEFDRAPVYEEDGRSVREVAIDDRRAFLERHSNHQIEELTAVSEARSRKGRFIEPMTVRYVEVSNGQELFVIRSSRRNIVEPLTYRLLPKQHKPWEE